MPDSPKQKTHEADRMLAIIEAAVDDAKGIEPRVLNVTSLTDITDYMLVVTGTSDRHVKTVADRVLEHMAEAGWKHLGIEGESINEWILIDYVDVVVHVMRDAVRKRYDLESLWDETLSELLTSEDSAPVDAAV